MKIQASAWIKTVIQIVEIWITLTVATLLAWEFLKLLDLWVLEFFNPVFNSFAELFGYSTVKIFVGILCAILVVMAGRWLMSWASNNWWQTPNNKWN